MCWDRSFFKGKGRQKWRPLTIHDYMLSHAIKFREFLSRKATRFDTSAVSVAPKAAPTQTLSRKHLSAL